MSYKITPRYPYLTAIASVFIIGLVVYGGSHNEAPGSSITTIIETPKNTFEEQYEMVVRNRGTAIDLSVRAGLVAEYYLQAHDEANYRKWKEIEEKHKKDAGLPK